MYFCWFYGKLGYINEPNGGDVVKRTTIILVIIATGLLAVFGIYSILNTGADGVMPSFLFEYNKLDRISSILFNYVMIIVLTITHAFYKHMRGYYISIFCTIAALSLHYTDFAAYTMTAVVLITCLCLVWVPNKAQQVLPTMTFAALGALLVGFSFRLYISPLALYAITNGGETASSSYTGHFRVTPANPNRFKQAVPHCACVSAV